MTDLVDIAAGDLACQIAPSRGGAITALTWTPSGGRAVPLLQPAIVPLSGHDAPLACFPLVPFSGRVAHGRFSHGGRDHAMPINSPPDPHTLHGDGWQAEWVLADRAADAALLTLDRADPRWPHAYRAEQHIRLAKDGLTIALSVTNTGAGAMPFGLGLHPYFPSREDTRLSVGVTHRDVNDATLIPVGQRALAPDERFDQRLIAGTDLDSGFAGFTGQATIDQPGLRYRLGMSASDTCGYLVVFTPAGQPYFCVEPVVNRANAFNAPDPARDGAHILAPGQRLAMEMCLRLVPGTA